LQATRLVVIAASAGGVDALSRLATRLPGDLPAAVLVVVHFPPWATSLLPRILDRRGPLPASHAEDGEPILMSHIYVAPPDRHLLVHPGVLRVARGPKENRVRPAADPLFRSAASAYGPAVIGVVLTGNLDDGALGLLAIRRHGGRTVVQDPADAAYTGMPLSALARAVPDHVCRIDDLAPLLSRLLSQPVLPVTPTAWSDLVR
jgi:two-component system chemotaxis response regulator CheB